MFEIVENVELPALKRVRKYEGLLDKRERMNAYARAWRKRPENVEKDLARMEAYRKTHLKERREYLFNLRKNNTVQFLLYEAKRRAKRKGIEFTITVDDVNLPSMCPVLGIPLIFGTSKIRDTSPTLDRTDNSRGYVPGNVKIISWRANTLKSSGTLDEHQKIVDYMRRELTSET